MASMSVSVNSERPCQANEEEFEPWFMVAQQEANPGVFENKPRLSKLASGRKYPVMINRISEP
jgi:hypothetical protein